MNKEYKIEEIEKEEDWRIRRRNLIRMFSEEKTKMLREKMVLYRELQQTNRAFAETKKELMMMQEREEEGNNLFTLLKGVTAIVQKWNASRKQLVEAKLKAEKASEEKTEELRKEKEIAFELRNRNESLEKENHQLRETSVSLAIQAVEIRAELEQAEKDLEAAREKLRMKEARILELCLQSLAEGNQISTSSTDFGRVTSTFFQRLITRKESL